MPARIYHGTSERNAFHALKSGIAPRRTRSGNWKHTISSNPKMVYLTAAYAPNFGFMATKTAKEPAAIIEIDFDALESIRR